MSKCKVYLMVLLLPLFSACATIDAFLFDAHPDGTPISRDKTQTYVASSNDNDTQLLPQDRTQNEELREEAEALREAVNQQQAELEAIRAHEAAEQLAAAKAATSTAVSAEKEQLWVRVTFKPGQTGLTEQVRKALSDVAAKFPAGQSKQTLAVRAYCDNEPIGGFDGKQRSAHRYASQQDLSQARADMVKDVLVKAGISSEIINARGYGASGFIADNSTAEGRDKNRRVDIFLLGE